MKERRMIALLGRRDHPTDALEEYCRYLREALRTRGAEMEIERVDWAEVGWSAALEDLRKKASMWQGRWVLLQYTALSWSARGFPNRVLRVLQALGEAGARAGVVFHDVEPYMGERVVDKVRRSSQVGTMRRAVLAAKAVIFTVPVEKLSWTIPGEKKAAFIPVGANLLISSVRENRTAGDPPTVAVFGITGGAAGTPEIAAIAAAVRVAARDIRGMRLVLLGRNSEGADARLREALGDVAVEVQALGVVPAEQVVRELCAADVLLFVRGGISSRRGSAIAGIACGLPVVAYAGAETAAPVTEAGVVLVAAQDKAALGEALRRVLTDGGYRAGLAKRSREAYEKYFAWSAIAERYDEFLD
jgi:glycosyltransferase involved in cell wall biosynthesis